jgi:phosphatidylglycerol:prolipoprotein diacylglycerol transferase
MTVIGGLVLATLGSISYLWLKKQPFLEIADTIIPSVALGIFLTRIGCFLNGCCFGRPGDSPFCMVFPTDTPAGFTFPNQTIIPTQLYSSLYGLIIFLTLLFLEKKFHSYNGFTFYLFFILYGLARFIIDFFRYYESSMIFIQIGSLAISVNQVMSLLFAILFSFLLLYFKFKSKTKGKNP